jgi:Right handed beta helix region
LAAPSSGTYATGQQLVVESLTIDGNLAGNPGGTGHGLVLMNYRATVRDLVVSNTPGSGIVLSDRGRAAVTVAAENCVENRVYDCTIEYPGQYGIWVIDTNLSGRVTDGYMENCVVVGPAGQGLRIERSAGWFISSNHIYGCATDGIFLDQFSGTFFHDNEVDHFGQAGAEAPGTFHGIQINNVIAGRPGAVHNCQVNAEEMVGSAYVYYEIRAAGGIEGDVQVLDNACHCSPQAAASGSSIAFSYVAGPGSILHVQGQVTNVAYGPAEYLAAGGGGTITFAQPPDPLGLGYATTIPPGTTIGATFAPGAGNAAFAMFLSAGLTTSALRLDVAVSAGDISLGIYTSESAGLDRKPATRQVTTGPIPCPAVGVVTVSLPIATVILPSSYAAISVDNDQASVACVNTLVPAMTVGTAAFQADAHPLPAVAASANGNSHIPWVTSA